MHRSVRRQHLWLPILLIGYLVLGVSTVFGHHGFLHLWQLRQEQHQLETRVFTLLQENKDLRDRIRRLQTDEEFFEKVVREQLGFVREGEIVYRF